MRTALPALVVSGRFDPITPPSFSDQALRRLPNAWYVEAPTQGHAPLLTLGVCGNAILHEFLDAPGRRPDATCAMQPMEWLVPDSTEPDPGA